MLLTGHGCQQPAVAGYGLTHARQSERVPHHSAITVFVSHQLLRGHAFLVGSERRSRHTLGNGDRNADGGRGASCFSGSTEFDPIKLFLQPMKGVVADFTTRAHREQGAPSGADGTRVQPIGRQRGLFSW